MQIIYVRSTIDDFLWPNRYLLKSLGFWPMESNVSSSIKIFAGFRIAITIIIICSILFIPMLLMVIVCWGDLSIVSEIGCLTITVGQLVFKLLYMVARQNKFCKIYQNARELWLITNDKKERENFEKLAKQGKQLTIIFFLTGIWNVIVITGASIFFLMDNSQKENANYTRALPLNLWYGLDIQQTPLFEMLFCVQPLAMLLGATGIIGFDSTMMTLILHICGQFKLVHSRFRSIGDKLRVSDHSKLHYLKPILEIGNCIAHHRRAISIAKEMNNLLSPVIFVQLMTSGLAICLGGYALLMGTESGNSTQTTQFVIYIITIFLQLVIWCWPGEILINESTSIADAISYEMPWYELSAGQQRDLGFIIIRTQKECHITALNFQIMSLSKLTEVFNAAASYFALLRSVNEK